MFESDESTIVASALTSAHRMFDEPAAPAGPVGPLAPVAPFGPVEPAGPAGPAGPLGTWPFLKSARSSEWFLTLLLVTALFLSCAVPTLFLGRAVAAQLTPPSASSRATHAMTIAGDGRWRRRRAIMSENPLVAFWTWPRAVAPAARANFYLRLRRSNFLLANLLHPLLQRLDVGHECLRLVQQTPGPHGGRALVVGGQREALVAAE